MVRTLKFGSQKDDSLSMLLDRLSKRSRKGIDVKKYSGILKPDKDPLSIINELRNDWVKIM